MHPRERSQRQDHHAVTSRPRTPVRREKLTVQRKTAYDRSHHTLRTRSMLGIQNAHPRRTPRTNKQTRHIQITAANQSPDVVEPQIQRHRGVERQAEACRRGRTACAGRRRRAVAEGKRWTTKANRGRRREWEMVGGVGRGMRRVFLLDASLLCTAVGLGFNVSVRHNPGSILPQNYLLHSAESSFLPQHPRGSRYDLKHKCG